MSINISVSSERSRSRGRGLQSTGRGGIGNCTPSPDGVEGRGPEGREPIPSGDPDVIISTGIGGYGNIRSPSRDPSRPRSSVDGASPSPGRSSSEVRGRPGQGYDQDRISVIDAKRDNGVYSSGRGGAGNMVRTSPGTSRSRSREPGTGLGGLANVFRSSTSRSRSREPAHGTGRGGYGNAYVGEPIDKDIMEVDESERVAHLHPPGVHSTGRGGVGNLTLEPPYTEGAIYPHGADHPHATHTHDHTSHGRGGKGNISEDHPTVVA